MKGAFSPKIQIVGADHCGHPSHWAAILLDPNE